MGVLVVSILVKKKFLFRTSVANGTSNEIHSTIRIFRPVYCVPWCRLTFTVTRRDPKRDQIRGPLHSEQFVKKYLCSRVNSAHWSQRTSEGSWQMPTLFQAVDEASLGIVRIGERFWSFKVSYGQMHRV